MNFATQRQTMVDTQLKTVGVNDADVLAAMATVPREAFVPAAMKGLAYADAALEVAPGRWLLEPMVLGLLLTHARLAKGSAVLVVGAATGYSAAVCARMGMRVTALEDDAALAAGTSAGVSNVAGPLAEGWARGAPYDLMLFEGAIELVPETLAAQLADGGQAAAVVREQGVGRALVGRVVGGKIAGLPFLEVAARPLPGFARPRAFAF